MISKCLLNERMVKQTPQYPRKFRSRIDPSRVPASLWHMLTIILAADVQVYGSFVLFAFLCARLIGFTKWAGRVALIYTREIMLVSIQVVLSMNFLQCLLVMSKPISWWPTPFSITLTLGSKAGQIKKCQGGLLVPGKSLMLVPALTKFPSS